MERKKEGQIFLNILTRCISSCVFAAAGAWRIEPTSPDCVQGNCPSKADSGTAVKLCQPFARNPEDKHDELKSARTVHSAVYRNLKKLKLGCSVAARVVVVCIAQGVCVDTRVVMLYTILLQYPHMGSVCGRVKTVLFVTGTRHNLWPTIYSTLKPSGYVQWISAKETRIPSTVQVNISRTCTTHLHGQMLN